MQNDSLALAQAAWLAPLETRIIEVTGDTTLLADMIAYHFSTGGKRIRGLIPPWVCENLGADGALALDLGAGLEILHNATLVHDDIQDGDTHRRGKQTVWNRWGEAQGINVGDSLFFHGLSLIARAPAGAALLPAVCDAMQRVVRGQVMEFQLQRPDGDPDALPHTFENFAEMARSKTGALFGICLEAGAAAGGASAQTQLNFRGYGIEIGLLFQVQDDYLDLVGDKGREVKGSDIAEGKLSFPVVWAYENGSAAAVSELRAIVRSPRAETSSAQVQRALDLLDDVGALSATAAWLREQRDLAQGSPVARYAPGLVERFLKPVTHAL